MMDIEYRKNWINNVKSLAILQVLLIHVSSVYIIGDWDKIQVVSGELVNSFSRVAVPLFVTVSGFLNIKGKNSSYPIAFYKNKMNRIIYALVFWSASFLIWKAIKSVYIYGGVNYQELISSLIQGRPYYHLWYLYMLIGLYLITPFVYRMFDGVSERVVLAVIVALFIIVFVDDIYRRVLGIDKGFFLTWFFSYLPYYLLGYYLRKFPCKMKPRMPLLSYLVISFFVFSLIFTWPNEQVRTILWSYFSIPTIISTILVFIFFMNMGDLSLSLGGKVAEYSFGVYLVHPIWIDVLKFFGVYELSVNPLLLIFSITMLTLLLSMGVVAIFSKFKLLNRCV